MATATFLNESSDEAIIEIVHQPGFFARLMGGKAVTRSYRGSGTVWSDAETGRRMPTHVEVQLADIWTKAIWQRNDARRAAS